jgi:hypothetical protein
MIFALESVQHDSAKCVLKYPLPMAYPQGFCSEVDVSD